MFNHLKVLFLALALAVTGAAQADTIRQTSVRVRDMAYDPATQRIYGTLVDPNTNTSHATLSLDPTTGAVGPSVEVGANAGKVALSRDGQVLYIAIDNGASIRKVDLTTQTAGLQISLGSHSSQGAYRVRDMEVLPGNSAAIAVARATVRTVPSPPYQYVQPEDVVIYDGATRRPNATNYSTSPLASGIEFGATASRLYGSGPSGVSSNNLTRMDVTASGVALADSANYPIHIRDGDPRFANGRLYLASGDVLDAESKTFIGKFPGVADSPVRAVCPDPANGRVFFLIARDGKTLLCAYDINTLVLLGSLEVPASVYPHEDTRLIRWGADGLAFNAGNVFLIQSSLVNGAITPTPAPTPTVVAENILRLNLPTNDLVFDAPTGRIYASVPGNAGSFGNSLTSLNPLTATMESSVFVGSEPGKLARSDNGQYLYAVLDGSADVRRFDVATQTAGLQFPVGRDYSSTTIAPIYFAEDIEVMPGSPGVVAISRNGSGAGHMNVAIYDDGVPRPTVTTYDTTNNVIEFGASPTRLYGHNNENTGFQFNRMEVGTSGVTTLSQNSGLLWGFDENIEYDSGRIYSSNGKVLDAEGRRVLATVAGVAEGSVVCPDAANNRIFYLTSGWTSASIHVFDASTYEKVGTIEVPGAGGVSSSLIRWGADGLAFRTGGGSVYILRSALVSLSRSLTVSIRTPSVVETAGATATMATVSRHGATDEALTVALASSDISEARVPATVTIPVGATSIEFPIAAIDDTVADGIVPATISASVGDYLTGRASLSVVDNESRTVRGRIVNHSGQGIANIIVQRNGAGNVVTDANGEYLFPIVTPGTHTIAPLLTPGLAGTTFSPASRLVTVGNVNVSNINFIASFTVSGRVVTNSGVGISHVVVTRRQGNSVVTAQTDASGLYQFRDVRSGTYTIGISPTPATNGMTFNPPSQQVTVGTANLFNQSFVAWFSVSGRVANNDGVAIPNVQIRLQTATSAVTVVTDINGFYRFNNVRSGDYHLLVNPTPAMAGMTLYPNKRNITVSTFNLTNQNFTAWFSISGFVTHSLTGQGMANVEVKRQIGTSTVRVFTNAQGYYEFRDVRSGTYTISPVYRGFVFNPPSRSVAVATSSSTSVNFTASNSGG